MDDTDPVYVDDRAWIAWQMAPALVKTDILNSLTPLAGQPPESWPKTRIKRWWNREDLYVLPVWRGPDELFIFFYPRENRIHIEGMYGREVIESISGRSVAELTK